MNAHRPEHGEQGENKAQEYAELLENALRQPGVREVMAVYENWKRFDAVAQTHRHALAVGKVITASNVSSPIAGARL